ncbi:MAG: NAD-dependent epimerase/dehydratase family protein [Chlorobiaceae bacterium]
MTVALVTGASGFIGSHLVKRCIEKGYSVKALVRKGNASIAGLKREGVDVVEGDIRQIEAVNSAVKDSDLVFHSAALTSDWGSLKDFRDINIGGTRNICEAVLQNKVKRLVHVSTFESFDHSRLERVDEKTPYSCRNQSYPDTKIKGNEVVWEYVAQGMQASIVYPVWVYGPGDRTLFPLLADGIRRRQFFYWSHHAPMSMVYIDNLLDLLMLAAEHPGAVGEDFLAYDGEPITFDAVCERIASAIHSPPPSLYLPYNFVYILAGMMELLYRMIRSSKRPLLTRQAVTLLASHAVPDASKARRFLGWSPGVSQNEGISRTLKWLLSVDPSEWKVK